MLLKKVWKSHQSSLRVDHRFVACQYLCWIFLAVDDSVTAFPFQTTDVPKYALLQRELESTKIRYIKIIIAIFF